MDYAWVTEDDVTFDSKVISVNYNLRRNLHTINNYCAKYEDPLSKMNGEFALRMGP